MSTTATDRRERLRERWIVDSKYVVARDGSAHYELHIGRTPDDRRPFIAVTRDEALYNKGVYYEGDACMVDAWIVRGRPTGTTADGVITQVRQAESES